MGHRRLELRANGLRDGKGANRSSSDSINVHGEAVDREAGGALIQPARHKGVPEFRARRCAADAALGAYLGVLASAFAAPFLTGQTAPA